MALQIYNTMTREKAPFEPLIPGKVRMYLCGPTVYDMAHVGHARSAMAMDIAHRWLREKGFEVVYARNYTDVDDKIIQRARERNVAPEAIAQQYTEAYREDLARLGILPPTHEPKATENIEGMIEVIRALESKGLAYAVDGDVWFSVPSYPGYGKLSRRKLEDMQAGARVDPGERKRNPADFALWKSAKPGEPSWDSPWGKGRPGWHIECSAMARRYLDQPFDIHAGGEDLVFPHHENEIAQSEGAFGTEFARVWMHNAFVNMNREKMSKSLGNVVNLRDILQKFPPEAFRLFCLSAHYRHPLDFTEQAMVEATDGVTRLYRALAEADRSVEMHKRWTVEVGNAAGTEADEAKSLLGSMRERFTAAMDDDFNSAQALAILFEAARALNRLTARDRLNTGAQQLVTDLGVELRRLGNVLGLLREDPSAWLQADRTAGLEETGVAPEVIEAKIAERNAARSARDFKKADEIRGWLGSRGIVLEDSADGTTWRIETR